MQPERKRNRGGATFLELAVLVILCLLVLSPAMCRPRSGGEKEEIKLWVSCMPSERPLFLEAVALFEQQNPGVEVRYEEPSSSSRLDKFLAAMQAGSCGDVLYIHWTNIPTFASKNTLLPLDGLCARDGCDLGDFFPGGLDAYRYDNRLCALPFKGSTMVLFYNKDIFDKAGVAYPNEDWTWDDFLEAAKKLTVTDDLGRMVQVGCLPYDPASWVWSAGGDFASNDCRQLHFTDPATLLGLEFYAALRNRWKVTTRNMNMAGRDPAAVDVFEKGNVAMAVTGPWMLTRYLEIKHFDWDIALFPKGPAGRQTRYAGMGFGVWSGTPKRELAWRLAKFICGEQAGRIFSKGFLDTPARRSIAYGGFARQAAPFDMNVLLKSMEPEYAKVRVYPKSESWPDVARFYSEEYEAVLVGKKTLREGMQEVEAQSRRFLAQRDVEVTPGHYAGVALLAFGIVVCVIRSLRRTRPGGDV